MDATNSEEYHEYIARMPLPSRRYNPPRKIVAQNRFPALCGRNVNFIQGNILKQYYKTDDGALRYIFFWEFDESKQYNSSVTIEDINIFREDGKFSYVVSLNSLERNIFTRGYLHSIPIFGCVGIDHISGDMNEGSHVFPYILIHNTLILLETNDTFNKHSFGAKLGHLDTLLRGLNLITRTDIPKHSEYTEFGEKLTYTDKLTFGSSVLYAPPITIYRPVLQSESSSYDLQRRDSEYTRHGFCPMWSTLLLKRVSQLNLHVPLEELLRNINGIYEELNTQVDTPDGLLHLFSEFYGSVSGGRRRKTRRQKN